MPLVRGTLEQVAEVIDDEEPDHRAHPRLRDDLASFTGRLITGQPAGATTS